MELNASAAVIAMMRFIRPPVVVSKVKRLRFHQRLRCAAVDVVQCVGNKDIGALVVSGKAAHALCALIPVRSGAQSVKK
jgi:hypothetical protein